MVVLLTVVLPVVLLVLFLLPTWFGCYLNYFVFLVMMVLMKMFWAKPSHKPTPPLVLVKVK